MAQTQVDWNFQISNRPTIPGVFSLAGINPAAGPFAGVPLLVDQSTGLLVAAGPTLTIDSALGSVEGINPAAGPFAGYPLLVDQSTGLRVVSGPELEMALASLTDWGVIGTAGSQQLQGPLFLVGDPLAGPPPPLVPGSWAAVVQDGALGFYVSTEVLPVGPRAWINWTTGGSAGLMTVNSDGYLTLQGGSGAGTYVNVINNGSGAQLYLDDVGGVSELSSPDDLYSTAYGTILMRNNTSFAEISMPSFGGIDMYDATAINMTLAPLSGSSLCSWYPNPAPGEPVALFALSTGGGHEVAFAVQGNIGQSGTLLGGAAVTGGIVTGLGSSGLSWGVITGTPTTLAGYGITSPLPVAEGGTGLATLSPWDLLLGGTSGTGALQQVSGQGAAGEVLTSAGPAALPVWAGVPVGMVVGEPISGGTGGRLLFEDTGNTLAEDAALSLDVGLNVFSCGALLSVTNAISMTNAGLTVTMGQTGNALYASSGIGNAVLASAAVAGHFQDTAGNVVDLCNLTDHITYAPGNPAGWTAPPPTDVWVALDRIVVSLNALLQFP